MSKLSTAAKRMKKHAPVMEAQEKLSRSCTTPRSRSTTRAAVQSKYFQNSNRDVAGVRGQSDPEVPFHFSNLYSRRGRTGRAAFATL
ncbi:hypothetical protein EVAR_39874_1 [Eumeta japonica]|uniref:Uncharacterized protein n=1 Tax=Eumeta variegata TaxID=151549 RepID=A0A4C1WSA4_EUMVA|nr:hypothetical protein EVAR_39874_1 [Eumeta japonica]